MENLGFLAPHSLSTPNRPHSGWDVLTVEVTGKRGVAFSGQACPGRVCPSLLPLGRPGGDMRSFGSSLFLPIPSRLLVFPIHAHTCTHMLTQVHAHVWSQVSFETPLHPIISRETVLTLLRVSPRGPEHRRGSAYLVRQSLKICTLYQCRSAQSHTSRCLHRPTGGSPRSW